MLIFFFFPPFPSDVVLILFTYVDNTEILVLCLQVKRNISDLTNIPVRHQQWEGWPASATDDSVRDTQT